MDTDRFSNKRFSQSKTVDLNSDENWESKPEQKEDRSSILAQIELLQLKLKSGIQVLLSDEIRELDQSDEGTSFALKPAPIPKSQSSEEHGLSLKKKTSLDKSPKIKELVKTERPGKSTGILSVQKKDLERRGVERIERKSKQLTYQDRVNSEANRSTVDQATGIFFEA